MSGRSNRGDVRRVPFGTQTIAYQLTFAERSQLSITVHPDLRVTALAPIGRTAEEVDARLHARAGWILRQQRELARYHPLPQLRRYLAGETHYYLGRQYRLRITESRQAGDEGVRLIRPHIVVRVTDRDDVGLIAARLDDWYRQRARSVFRERLEHLSREAPSLSGDVTLRVRRMRARWGSCTAGGVVTLTPELVKAPRACIDYVILHELCHRKVMSHGPRFVALLSRHMPDWRRRRDRLNVAVR